MTLTYDMTFAVILLSSLYERIPELEKHRCKIHPVKKQMMASFVPKIQPQWGNIQTANDHCFAGCPASPVL